MKNLTLFTVFISFLIKIQAQTVVIAADKMNVSYIGLTNPISIAVESVSDEKLKISTDNGKIIRTERGHYMYIPDQIGFGNIIIEWERKKEVKPFRVKAFPNPTIKVGGWTSGYIYADAFNGMVALVDNMDIDAKCSVIGYTCTLVSSSKEAKSVKVVGPINQDISKLLSTSKKGDKVIFSEISVRCPGDNMPRLFKDIITRIVK